MNCRDQRSVFQRQVVVEIGLQHRINRSIRIHVSKFLSDRDVKSEDFGNFLSRSEHFGKSQDFGSFPSRHMVVHHAAEKLLVVMLFTQGVKPGTCEQTCIVSEPDCFAFFLKGNTCRCVTVFFQRIDARVQFCPGGNVRNVTIDVGCPCSRGCFLLKKRPPAGIGRLI